MTNYFTIREVIDNGISKFWVLVFVGTMGNMAVPISVMVRGYGNDPVVFFLSFGFKHKLSLSFLLLFSHESACGSLA